MAYYSQPSTPAGISSETQPRGYQQQALKDSFPLSAIKDELAIDEEQEDNEPLLQPSHTSMTRQTLTLIASTVRSQHQPASGGSQKPRRSSRNSKSTITYAGKHSTRAKISDKDHHRLFASSELSSTTRRLRTTKPWYPPSRTTFPSASTDTSKENKRTSHSLVEKQYRTRLNGLFATLLSATPKDVIAADVNGYTTGDGSPGKVVSKGAVLALARRPIEALEKREKSLEGEKEILMEKIQRLERGLARLGVDIIQ
jgi:hypothetical protein